MATKKSNDLSLKLWLHFPVRSDMAVLRNGSEVSFANNPLIHGMFVSAAMIFRSVPNWRAALVVSKNLRQRPLQTDAYIDVRAVLDPSCGAGGLSDRVIAAQQHGKMKAATVRAVGLILIGQLLPSATCAKVSLNVSAILFVDSLGFDVFDTL